MIHLTRLCALFTIGFYISIIMIVVKYRKYFILILSNVKFRYDTKKIKNTFFSSKVYAQFNEYYQLYESFYCSDLDITLYPDERMIIFGIVKQKSACIFKCIENKIVRAIVLNDIDYPDVMLDDLRKVYRFFVIFMLGGYLLWQIGIMYLTLQHIK